MSARITVGVTALVILVMVLFAARRPNLRPRGVLERPDRIVVRQESSDSECELSDGAIVPVHEILARVWSEAQVVTLRSKILLDVTMRLYTDRGISSVVIVESTPLIEISVDEESRYFFRVSEDDYVALKKIVFDDCDLIPYGYSPSPGSPPSTDSFGTDALSGTETSPDGGE